VTVFAAAVCHPAETGQRRKRAVYQAQNLAECYRVGGLQKGVSAGDTASALDKPGMLEIEQNLLEELSRHAVLFSHFGNGNGIGFQIG
jgi:hypothetical protein